MIALFAKPDPVGDLLRAYPWVIPLFVVFWIWLITNLIARLSGWSALAEHYRANGPFEGVKWTFQSVQMRYLTHYNNALTFGASPQGLYMAVLFIVRPGHPPLLVPWEELQIQAKKRWMVMGYELRFRQTPGVYMWVRAQLGDKILLAAQTNRSGVWMAPQIG